MINRRYFDLFDFACVSRNMMKNPSKEFINKICSLYGGVYDDREEDSRPGGEDWAPGRKADHVSLAAFKRRLSEDFGIELST